MALAAEEAHDVRAVEVERGPLDEPGIDLRQLGGSGEGQDPVK
jgi:hypothetical protein